MTATPQGAAARSKAHAAYLGPCAVCSTAGHGSVPAAAWHPCLAVGKLAVCDKHTQAAAGAADKARAEDIGRSCPAACNAVKFNITGHLEREFCVSLGCRAPNACWLCGETGAKPCHLPGCTAWSHPACARLCAQLFGSSASAQCLCQVPEIQRAQTQAADSYVVCAVCNNGDDRVDEAGVANKIVFCDGCSLPVHVFCYRQPAGGDPLDEHIKDACGHGLEPAVEIVHKPTHL